MSNFSVGSLAQSALDQFTGQSFVANAAGPSGTGSPGTSTSMTVNSISVGFPSTDTNHRPAVCYLYSAPLDDYDDVGTSTNLIAQSSGVFDSQAFGSGSYTRTYQFGLRAEGLSVSTTYYAYFGTPGYGYVDTPNGYPAGTAYDGDGDSVDESLQFLVQMTTD